MLASLLPGYTAVAGRRGRPAGRRTARRRRFGNMILSRLPVLQAFRHLLPYPADHDVPSMPRVAVEAVVRAPFGDVRVITTHLEYYSLRKRSAQVEALRAIYAEGYALRRQSARGRAPTKVRTSRSPRPARDRHHRRLQPRARRSAARAAWARRSTTARRRSSTRGSVAHPGEPHRAHVPHLRKEGARRPRAPLRFHLRQRRPALARQEASTVDTGTQVSDHQPVLLELR